MFCVFALGRISFLVCQGVYHVFRCSQDECAKLYPVIKDSMPKVVLFFIFKAEQRDNVFGAVAMCHLLLGTPHL